MAAEDHVKGLIVDKLCKTEGYSDKQDTTTSGGVTWYKERSYQNNKVIEALLSNASKSFNGSAGTPDFVVDTPEFRIVIEAKGIERRNRHRHSRFNDVKQYIRPNVTNNDQVYDTQSVQNRDCAIDEVLYYATFLNVDKDVIAIAVSGTNEDDDCKLTSFFVPMKENLSKIELVENGMLKDTFNSVAGYKKQICEFKGEHEKKYRDIHEHIRKYVDATSKFLDTNGIEVEDRLGIVSAVVLGLTNKESALYKKVMKQTDLEITREEVKDALMSDSKPLGIIVSDGLPAEKQRILTNYFNTVLNNDKLTHPVAKKEGIELKTKDYFEVNKGFVNEVLSRLTYSLFKYIVKLYEQYHDAIIDIMGAFYSLFLQYTKTDVKKGVVLTPKHIADLFCDLAEYFYGAPLTEETTVLDIATGSGGFLIAALNRMDRNIENSSGLNEDKKQTAKEKVRKNCLIGIENQSKMYVMAYVNMRFHHDGRSSLHFGSSLRSAKEAIVNNMTFESYIASTYKGDDSDEIDNAKKIEKCGAHIGMVNPPYEEDVFEFIDSMLRYLRRDGIGIAIVPINTQSTNREMTKKKNDILKNNTLLASILMPPDLFKGVKGSGAATSTCVLVFKAHSPHSEFVNRGGLTYLADWSTDGFVLVPKHGRFEINNAWHSPVSGYLKLYMDDLKHQTGEISSILSSEYQKDIHQEGAIKSIRKPIHKFDRIESFPRIDKEGKVVYKMGQIPKIDDMTGEPLLYKTGKNKGKIKTQRGVLKDKDGMPIPEMDTKEIYLNEDWNILDYVETDYNLLSADDFIKSLLDYKLFTYMKEHGMLFEGEESENSGQ